MRSSASRLSSFSSRDSLWNRMPDQISVSEFIAETTEDYNSPTTSSFTTRLHNCRNTVTLLEEGSRKMSIYQLLLTLLDF
uniref:arf-GAP with SH3 domain, ANK repeat and PH domain-containing protein 1 isoform X10 n=1 Tax=Ictidomys tridecemlineatus TaxID=43179 RepID=UPI001A9F41B6|nr:arf-GAP with SH3 domain, ANK repeat and PH domain-containing protein 1 isoform X10 [Ictidomys tridecemlineatus]